MRPLLILCAALVLSGCFGQTDYWGEGLRRAGADGAFASAEQTALIRKLIVTPGSSLVGRIAFVNTTARFVVLNFPIGQLPAIRAAPQHFIV